jgi:hypothetical protein
MRPASRRDAEHGVPLAVGRSLSACLDRCPSFDSSSCRVLGHVSEPTPGCLGCASRVRMNSMAVPLTGIAQRRPDQPAPGRGRDSRPFGAAARDFGALAAARSARSRRRSRPRRGVVREARARRRRRPRTVQNPSGPSLGSAHCTRAPRVGHEIRVGSGCHNGSPCGGPASALERRCSPRVRHKAD